MPHVDPHENKKAEIWANEWVVKIIQSLASCQEEITDVMRDENGETNPSEVIA